MDDQGDLHRYFDAVPGAFCLITADAEERIAFASADMLALCRCSDEAALAALTGGRFLGMVDETAPSPLATRLDQAGPENEGYRYVTFSLRGADNHFVQVEGSAKRVSIDGRPYWSLMLVDMRKRTAGIEGDDVTGLMGMHEFYEKSRTVAAGDRAQGSYGTRYPIYFNISNFKAYNRLHGIEAGDECLRMVAGELVSRFPDAMVAHLAADSFVVLEPAGADAVFERIEGACQAIDAAIGNPRIRAKAGVFVGSTPALRNIAPSDTVDFAKIACDSIKRDADTCWAVYTEEMGRRIEARAQVLETFDAALADGSIKVFAQPIVRACTGKVCAVEALARWDTPQGERLAPDEFVPVLEDARLIHKLDLHVIESVMRTLRAELDADESTVPVSVNISRVDFNLIDVYEAVDRAARTFEIPRDCLRIEVTETAISEKGTAVRDAIARFRANGYEVWIDDFGSGVSSLNLLKDCPVDGLKIDLVFMRNFNERARIIVTSIVRMAKGLGVHTIAEGVETPEQADFLKSIGCEMVQGYLYGKPALATALLARCRRLGMEEEDRFEGQLFDRAGLVDISGDAPVAVVRFQGEQMKIICESPAYRDALGSAGSVSVDEANRILASHDFAMREKFLAFARKVVASGAPETMTYVDDGQYFRLNAQLVADVGDTHVVRVSLSNITHDEDRGASARFDAMLRSLALTYDGIYYLHVGDDKLEVVESMDPNLAVGSLLPGIESTLAKLARERLHSEDLERFLRFARIDNLHALARESQRSEATNLFRVRHDDGSYRWAVFDAVVLTRTEHKDILFCKRDDVMERQRDVSTLLPAFAASFGIPLHADRAEDDLRANLWQSYADFSADPVFWKDRERRYVGANRAFLDAFGLASLDEIAGKTDDELGWNADGAKEREDELAVLEEGAPVRDRIAPCLMRGAPRTIVGSKYPVYEGGRIVGLEGSFRLLEEAKAQEEFDEKAILANHESGLPGYRSMIMTGLRYAGSLQINGEDYLMVLIDVPEFDRVCTPYGAAFRRDLFERVYAKVSRIRAPGGSLSHIGSCCFAYLQKGADASALRTCLLAVANDVHGITEVDGCACTLYLQYAIVSGSEARSFDGLMRMLIERLGESEEQSYGREMFVGDRILFDREKFDNLPDPVAMWDLDTYEMLYMNAAYLHDLRLPESFAYVGRPCYEIVEGYKEPCPFCRKSRLRRDRFDVQSHHNQVTGVDYLVGDTLVPWRGKDRVFSVSLNLSSYIERDKGRNEFIFREAAANDAIAVGMQEVDPREGIRKFLGHVGRNLGAERLFVFEEAGDGTVNATFEWKRDADAPDLLPELERIPLSEVRALLGEFDKTPVTLIENIEAFRCAHPGFVVHVDGAKSVVSGFLNLSNGRSGYSLVVNPSPDTFHSASLLLTTLTRFLEVMLRNRDIVAHLKEISTTDQLTGVMNRRALIERLSALPAGREIAIVFGDVNGLKKVNDEQGHRKGDELIASVAQVMSGIVGCDKVFRMGGDEFLMIVENAAGRDIDAIMRELRRGFARHGASVALGCACCTTPIESVDAVISKVDRLMYADKGAHYFGRRATDN